MNEEDQQSVEVSTEIDLEDIEVRLLLEAIYQRWGYDFRDYAPISLKRRILRIVEIEKVQSISALQEQILRDSSLMQRFLNQLMVSVTSMFRDPHFYLSFRKLVMPLLKEKQQLRIWHAGCASGEEVYSMLILLHEEGIIDRVRIYATDLDQTGLDKARQGIYSIDSIKEYTENFQAAGGKTPFSNYYYSGHGNAVMRRDLSENVVWAQHNLVTDASFNEFDVIFCRNVLIYFNEKLQDRVHKLLHDSLTEDGILILGRQESLRLTSHVPNYSALDRREKIYQRIQ
ncbi:MAG: protein-glutamate O-methyltransferase CheR [Actinomycetota bacterium]